MPGIKYIGPAFDGSGYAEAARNYILAIHKAGYPITIAPITFEKTRPDLGKDSEILKSLVNKPVDYDKVIVHCTPDLWQHYTKFESNKYIIGFTVWETSQIHPSWVVACNRVDEVWVPCQWNVEVFKNSGVKCPIYKIPHTLNIPDMEKVSDFNLEGLPENTFTFYSIFQWQERKNPYGLLAAYCAAFSGVEDVALVIKSYLHDHAGDKDSIRDLILQYKQYMTLDHFPKIYLIVDNLSKDGILSLHKKGDCFVLLQRSEGWGYCHFEAAAMANPIITPSYGGQTEFLKEDNSYLVDYQETPVSGMPWSPYYRGDQWWCEPNIKQTVSFMRHVYENRKEAKEKGLKARDFILNNFNQQKIGDLVVKRVLEIDGKD